MSDSHHLRRFIDAQEPDYRSAVLNEIVAGQKVSHWMWYGFVIR